jgi:hypothetical protein
VLPSSTLFTADFFPVNELNDRLGEIYWWLRKNGSSYTTEFKNSVLDLVFQELMMNNFKVCGLEALELDLRTSFMSKMVTNQERTIVEQTIR